MIWKETLLNLIQVENKKIYLGTKLPWRIWLVVAEAKRRIKNLCIFEIVSNRPTNLLTYRLLCDAISDHLLLEVCCILLTVASNQFSLVVIIGNLFSTQDCISWSTTESGGQSVEGGDQRGTGLHRQGGGLWICPRGNSISPVRERTHSHSV